MLADGTGDSATEAAGVTDGDAGAELEKTALGDAMERSSHVPRRSYGQYSAGSSSAAAVATVDMPNTRCTVSAAASTAKTNAPRSTHTSTAGVSPPPPPPDVVVPRAWKPAVKPAAAVPAARE